MWRQIRFTFVLLFLTTVVFAQNVQRSEMSFNVHWYGAVPNDGLDARTSSADRERSPTERRSRFRLPARARRSCTSRCSPTEAAAAPKAARR